jgi:hypothetical protein
MGYVTACLKALQKRENESPTTRSLGHSRRPGSYGSRLEPQNIRLLSLLLAPCGERTQQPPGLLLTAAYGKPT